MKWLAAVLLLVANAAQADILGNTDAQRLVKEGQALASQGKYEDAFAKFKEASLASPEASSPYAAVAFTLLSLVAGDNRPEAGKQRAEAAGWAQKALSLDSSDPLANEVMRALDDEGEPPLHQASAHGNAVFKEGETLFHQGKYEEARAKYREAQRIDPAFSPAFVMEGDSYFVEKNWGAAEFLFQRAAEIEPLNAQAWRFLADARSRLKNYEGTVHAAIRAVAAMPSQKGNWDRIDELRKVGGKPLTSLNLQRRVRASRGGDGVAVEVAKMFNSDKSRESADYAVWLTFAMLEALDGQDSSKGSPFERTYGAWKAALEVAAEMERDQQLKLTLPDLLILRKLDQQGALKAGILLLMYREAYRPELEAWKAANPDGVRDFITTFELKP